MALRAGVIGLGTMGRHHARVYGELAGVDLVAVADSDPHAVAQATRGRTWRGYLDYRQMLERERLDLVSIAVPTALHEEVACAAIERGIHALVEKPIAATVQEGQRIAAAARAHDVVLTVGHIERFNAAILELKRHLAAGKLGKVFQIRARRNGPFPARIRDVGVVVDLATHDLDIMRFLLDSPVERIYAETAQRIHTAHEDLVIGLLRFANGVIGLIDVNWLTPTKVRELVVSGERGMFVASYLTQELYFYENNIARSEWDALDTLTGVHEGNMTRYHLDRREPLRVELEAFVAAVRDGQPPAVSAEDALAALHLAELLVASGRDGRIWAVEGLSARGEEGG
jgi:UDP-N-acetylglucosamine 3-dehydrogenase